MAGRRRRHRRKSESEQVTMNLAAMLDMAFQLLTFFILTFRPAPVEGQLSLNLPPPVPQVKVDSSGGPSSSTVLAESKEVLHLFVTAEENGDIAAIRLGSAVVTRGALDPTNTTRLDQRLKDMLQGQGIAFDGIQIAMDGKLRYGELMKVIDICTRQKKPDGSPMQNINFVEIAGGEG